MKTVVRTFKNYAKTILPKPKMIQAVEQMAISHKVLRMEIKPSRSLSSATLKRPLCTTQNRKSLVGEKSQHLCNSKGCS